MRRALAALVVSTGLTASEAARPNLVLAIFDDLNTTAVGCYGQHPAARTPHLDRLAARGVRFANAQTNAPICGPSRACLISGLLPTTTGYFGFDQQKHPWRKTPRLSNAVTLPEAAKAAGYHIYGCGKIWHNGHDEFKVFAWGDNTFGPRPEFSPMGRPGVSKAEAEAAMAAGKTTHLEAFSTFGPLSQVPPGGWQSGGRKSFRYVSEADRDRMGDEKNAAWATALIASGRLREPFLLIVGFNRPHQPETAPDPFFAQIPADLPLLPLRADDNDDLAPELRGAVPALWTGRSNLSLWSRFTDDAQRRRYLHAYLACTAFVDAQFGAVQTALDASPYAARTVTVATSDHGWHLGEKQRSFKNTPWEPACRIPFIAAGPGVAAGAVCAQPIALVDVYPSLADWGRWRGVPALDGHSIVPLCRTPTGGWSGGTAALTSIDPPWTPETIPPDEQRRALQTYSLRTARWRYIRASRGGEELYDHDADPNEWTNLAAKPEHAATLTELRGELARLTGISRWPDPASIPPFGGAGVAPGHHD